jgi:hypothetical protein
VEEDEGSVPDQVRRFHAAHDGGAGVDWRS